MPILSPQNSNHSIESEQLVYETLTGFLDFSESQAEIILQPFLKETYRFYHNLDHIADIIKLINNFDFYGKKNEWYHDKATLLYAAIFHDIVYDPRSKTNEEESAKFASEILKGDEEEFIIEQVIKIILATKTHTVFNSWVEELFCQFDLNSFEKSFNSVLEDERKIRKEYDWVDWSLYQSTRPEILGKFLKSTLLSDHAKQNIQYEIDYLKFCTPRIAVYPGSFDPIHIGHLNILQKAEKIFDKVIIAVGYNPEKALRTSIFHETLCDELKYRQVDHYTGLLTDYMKTKQYPLTVIRGLRNVTDMQVELNQYRWLQELSDNDIRVVSIFCDKDYEHISSSAIKNVQQYGDEYYKKYIVK